MSYCNILQLWEVEGCAAEKDAMDTPNRDEEQTSTHQKGSREGEAKRRRRRKE